MHIQMDSLEAEIPFFCFIQIFRGKKETLQMFPTYDTVHIYEVWVMLISHLEVSSPFEVIKRT